MLEPAFLDTLWTIAVIVLLVVAAGLCLIALPWDEREIRKVHETALALVTPRVLAHVDSPPRRAARR